MAAIMFCQMRIRVKYGYLCSRTSVTQGPFERVDLKMFDYLAPPRQCEKHQEMDEYFGWYLFEEWLSCSRGEPIAIENRLW
jgi:hypothetical protein